MRISLQTLNQNKLHAKFSKREFWLDTVHFLGYMVSKDRVSVDLAKIEAINDWKAPRSIIAVRSFLDLAGYYKSFEERFL